MIIWMILTTLFSHAFLHAQPLELSVEAESAILMNAETGAILYEKNKHLACFPASITKIATAAYIFKEHENKLAEIVIASQDAIGWVTEEAKKKANYTLPAHWLVPGGTHMNILKGEELTLEDLLYGLMLVSANDAANVLAEHLGGTVPDFMENLNAYTKQVGCLHSVFCNPHGLHHPEHKTTAYDMAILTREALKNPIFRQMLGTVKRVRPKTNKQAASSLIQNHPLLKQGKYYYAKAIGAKTGYTYLAQNNLVVAATDQERTLIAVLLRTKEREQLFKDAIKLFDTAFQQPKVERLLLRKGLQKFTLELPWAASPLQADLAEDLKVEYYPAEEPDFKCVVEWLHLTPPVMQGQVIGHISLKDSRNLIEKKVPIHASQEVTYCWSYWLRHSLMQPLFSKKTAKKAGFLMGFILVGGLILRLSKRR
ncbi:MAG: hypothetical protein CK425_05595 [Parachlamydia sp.]|nr:MAG: hypothetical protein CK425_05595 [Parachlamydia sp.]